ncbi:hypothetical protein BDW02DRAFT_70307 [Decorospora gaudefroyi]|uniref:Uncharacterized protein n=1 Tax=Decorospora gaudefroyi TaxID=184978 RepID=A0A6A5KCH0_9PLEO|nr:hypothetical protein BDW02DRAFT_70307 [Decorospora gaudefroyi]
MHASGISVATVSSYPPVRPNTPSRTQPSPSSDTPTQQRIYAPARPPPPSSGITHPSMHANGPSRASPSHERVGSKMFFEVPVNHIFSQPQPLSYPYASFAEDMWALEQQPVNMPDHNQYVVPVIARRNARQAAHQPQKSTRPPPYPLHDQDVETDSSGGVHSSYSSPVRQPKAEDYLRPQHPLPAPPTEEYDSDQDLPVIEPDSYVHENLSNRPKMHHTEAHTHTPDALVPNRRSTVANGKPHHTVGIAPAQNRSQSVLVQPSRAPSLAYESSASARQNTTARVHTMSSDMYQPALGGLQRISGIKRTDSKRDRLKRFMRNMIPFHRRREFGRAGRQIN